MPTAQHAKELNALAQEIHKNAAAHGWWETNPEFPEIAALCHSELSEALTEYRNGKPMLCCVDGKPEGIAVELADCVMRILDYCAWRKIDIDEALSVRQSVTDDFGALPELIAECHYRLSMAYKEVEPRSLYLAEIINLIRRWCAGNAVVIEEVIRAKHEYNKTRPYRHGGKIV
jgi:NTP pyrophosphatase (non-canonical NTP hydrolase)